MFVAETTIRGANTTLGGNQLVVGLGSQPALVRIFIGLARAIGCATHGMGLRNRHSGFVSKVRSDPFMSSD